jgi:ganglioside-induced differentiation-associated protein 1
LDKRVSETRIILYHGLASTCSKKVRLCLFEKGIDFESHLLDLQKFEQHRPEYLALNPNGVVPTLVHNDQPVIESSIINEYIDDAFPECPLKPADSLGRAKMRLWTKYSDDVAYKAVYVPTWHILRERASAGLSKSALDETLARVPTPERRERWEQMANGGYSESELAEAYNKMRGCLDRAESGLADTPWLAGDEYSLADIAMIPFIDRIRNLRPEFLPVGVYPRLTDWYARLTSRPAYKRAFNFTDDPRASELPNF